MIIDGKSNGKLPFVLPLHPPFFSRIEVIGVIQKGMNNALFFPEAEDPERFPDQFILRIA
jgi:hypothetical protein